MGLKRGVICLILLILLSSVIVTAALSVYPNVIVRLNKYTPVPAEPGRYIDVYFKVGNFAKTDVRDFVFTIDPRYPFSLKTGESASVQFPTLLGNQEVQIHYRLFVDEFAIEGNHSLYYYFDHSLISYPSEGQVEILIQTQDANIQVSTLSTIPERIAPGQPSKLFLEITNLADTTLKHLNVDFDFTETKISPINGVNEQTITTLVSGDKANFSFEIIADGDAPSFPVKVPLTVNFFDHLGQEFTKNYTASILVYEKPAFLITVEETTVNKAKSVGEVVIGISNIGTSELKFVRVQILPSEKYEILSAQELYLGNLESDDFQTAEFDIFPNTKKELQLHAIIKYKDTYNNEFGKEEVLLIPLYSGGDLKKYNLVEKKSKLGMIFFIIILFGIAWFFYRRWEKKIKK